MFDIRCNPGQGGNVFGSSTVQFQSFTSQQVSVGSPLYFGGGAQSPFAGATRGQATFRDAGAWNLGRLYGRRDRLESRQQGLTTQKQSLEGRQKTLTDEIARLKHYNAKHNKVKYRPQLARNNEAIARDQQELDRLNARLGGVNGALARVADRLSSTDRRIDRLEDSPFGPAVSSFPGLQAMWNLMGQVSYGMGRYFG